MMKLFISEGFGAIFGQLFVAIASPSTYPCQSAGQWVSGSVIKSFRFGDSYRISKLCELVFSQRKLRTLLYTALRHIASSPFSP